MRVWILLFLLSPAAVAKVMKGFELKGATVAIEAIQDGGVPRDGIPAIHKPRFLTAAKARTIFSNSARAIIVESQGMRRAYPISILTRHEIVNDKIGKTPLVVTYCPLCGTGMVFRSENRSFGVSGLLYQSDVLLYDKKTESLWTQIGRRAITGKLKGTKLKLFPSRLISLHPYLKAHPDTQVLSTQTGKDFKYFRNPYKAYAKSDAIFFKIGHRSKEVHPKTWSIYIEDGKFSLIAPLNRLPKGTQRTKVKVGNKQVELRLNQQRGELECLSASITCFTGYFFALKAFYPSSPVLQN